MFIMQQPKQPTRPAVAPTGAPSGELQMPRTRAEFDALVARREELKNQLQSVTERRRELFPQSMLARDASARSELNARIAALDQRSARLEQEILAADDAIATAAGRGIPGPAANNFGQLIRQMTIPSRRQDTRQVIANVVLGEALAFVLLGVVLWQFLWKRNWARMRTMGTSVDSSARLDQLQRAVDVIAVEVERISENQRYVTKILNENLPALGAGDAQQLSSKRKVAEPARASDDG